MNYRDRLVSSIISILTALVEQYQVLIGVKGKKINKKNTTIYRGESAWSEQLPSAAGTASTHFRHLHMTKLNEQKENIPKTRRINFDDRTTVELWKSPLGKSLFYFFFVYVPYSTEYFVVCGGCIGWTLTRSPLQIELVSLNSSSPCWAVVWHHSLVSYGGMLTANL